ncbi:O-antigen ligase family protein [Pseudoxanthomonas suwonensis]|uniref:O-antigen ligase family protein n=1 Tax=Pseudoxanthomonas suwonensis TaxID=314722 RepID=UPI001F3F66E8|nr:O-antigen ligase [Pseudoxanthomonas suwonensis]
MRSDNTGDWRLRWAQACAALGLWCLPALTLSIPKGLLPFGLLLLASTLLVPLRVARATRQIGWPWLLVALAGIVPLLVALVSIRLTGSSEGIDGRDRWLVLPWAMAWAWALDPPRTMLWRGALAGLLAAAALALTQVLAGAVRAGGWLNEIVFADVVLVLMVLAVFCRPPRSWHWSVIGLALGVLAILLSGTRGAWPGLLLMLLVLVLGSGWRSRRSRGLVLGAMVAAGIVLLASVPALHQQMRLAELRQDLARLDRGDHNSSAGARLERLRVAAGAFADAPWTGVGFGEFDRAMQRLPACRGDAGNQPERCHLDHAHNDLAEWAATMGIPGVAALAMLYGIPLWLFLHLRRGAATGRLRGAASAGAMVVAMFMLAGLTQSIFAHQTTTSVYAAVCGVLLGLALREAHWRDRSR